MSDVVYVVGDAQDLNDWNPIAAYRDEDTAIERAVQEQRTQHMFVRRARLPKRDLGSAMAKHGLTSKEPAPDAPDPGKGCCRPQVHSCELFEE